MKLPLYISTLVLALAARAASLAPASLERDPKAAWLVFEQALELQHPADAQASIGTRVLFRGWVLDGFTDKVHWLRPNPARVSIRRFDAVQHKWIDTGIVCRVTLRENEIKPVAGDAAASIEIRVLGTIMSSDPRTKTVEVRSEDTVVISAD